MKIILLAAGAAAVALSAGATLAAPKHSTTAGPSQPIPYAQLDAYLKASPKQRVSKDWWGGASTGAGANASATTTATPSLSSDTGAAANVNPPSAGGESKDATSASSPVTPPIDKPSTTEVNPPAAAPGAPPPTAPPK